jgi:hypothetical protein
MTLHKRTFTCAICGGAVIYDDERRVMRCKCSEIRCQIPEKDLMKNFRIQS